MGLKPQLMIAIFCYGIVAGEDRRSFPDAFSTYVSVYQDVSKTLSNALLSYDKTKNKGSLQAANNLAIYDFIDDELLSIEGTECKSEPLDKAKHVTFPFISQDRGGLEIASPDVLFHLDGEHVIVMLDEVLDGVSTQHWKSNKTMNVDSVNLTCRMDHWFENDNTPCANEKECYITPMRIDIRCTTNDSKVDPFNQFLRFYNFDPNPPPNEAFQQPLGVFCNGRKEAALPRAPSRFMYASEVLYADTMNPEYVTRRQLDYWYDRDFQLLRLGQLSNNNERNIATYFDYRKGICYIIDLDTGKCTVMNTNERLPSAEEVLWQTTKIENRQFQYVGQRTLNGIEYYVWACASKVDSTITDFEVKNLYYVKESVPESDTFKYLPVYEETYTIKDRKVEVIILETLTGYEITPSFWSSQDVSTCFNNPGQTLRFEIEIKKQTPASDDGISPAMVPLFKEGLHGQLLGAMGITPLRLNKMQIIHFEDGDVWTSAVLTESPSLLGLGKKDAEPNLMDAYKRLEDLVSHGKFQFTIEEPATKEKHTFKAVRVQELKNGGGTLLKANILKGKKPLSL